MKVAGVGLVAVAFAVVISCSGVSGLEWWGAPINRKIQPTTAKPGSQDLVPYLVINTPKASFGSGQFVLYGDAQDILIEATSLTESTTSSSIDSGSFVFFRQYWIDFAGSPDYYITGSLPVPEFSPTGDTNIPDPLVPLIDPYTNENVAQPFDCTAGENVALFVDVHVPKDAMAGNYVGNIIVKSGGSQLLQIPVHLQVWDFVLDTMNSVSSLFQLSEDTLTAYHDGTYDWCSGSGDSLVCYNNWSELGKEVAHRYEDLAHLHRIQTNPMFIRPAWDGCSVDFENTEYISDLSSYFDGTHFSDGVNMTDFTIPFSPGSEWDTFSSCSDSVYTSLAQSFAEEYKSLGWFESTISYASDEPPADLYPAIIADGLLMQQGDSDWKAQTLGTIQPQLTVTDDLDEVIGIYVVNPPWYTYWAEGSGPSDQYYGRSTWPTLFDKGIKLWFYESCSNHPPWPTFATNTLDAFEPAMLMWGSFFERATGFLFWSISAWDMQDPWGKNEEAFHKSGDGVLLYPGHHNGWLAPAGSPSEVQIEGPVASLRLKMLRSGLQDWAMFQQAEKLGLGESVRSIISRVYTQMGTCSWDGCAPALTGWFWNTTNFTALEEVRQMVADLIVANPSVSFSPSSEESQQKSESLSFALPLAASPWSILFATVVWNLWFV